MKAKANLLRKERVCEGHKETIQCPVKQKIHVEYASYGRMKNGHFCGAIVFNTNCHADNSLNKVRENCEDKRNCLLEANNGIFGDPCWGTQKYLEVSELTTANN